MRRRVLLFLLVLAVLLLGFSTPYILKIAPLNAATTKPIPDGLLYPWEYVQNAWNAVFHADGAAESGCEAFARTQPVESSLSIPHAAIPQHPFMAANVGNNMHCDSYISDTYKAAGPLGVNTEVRSRSQGFGGYGTIAIDQSGRLVAVYSNGRGLQLELMDPVTLEELASYDLPARPWYWLLQGIMPWEYIGAGMYFYLDDQDRAVVPTTHNTILVIQTPLAGASGDFELVREYDLSADVVPMRWPNRDSVAWVLPDWSGDVYWFATTGGMVGAVHRDSGAVQTLRLEDEIIENSFAVGEEGAYILSDCALYLFDYSDSAGISIQWRTPYDRGPAKKPGHITRGSGTSVTLMGGLDGLVAITDNAEPRISLHFIRRATGEIVGSIPVFAEGKSGTDVSVACFEHANEEGHGIGRYSVLIENNWGHHVFPHSRPESGLTRVDVIREDDGFYRCEQVWESAEKSIGVFKLSLGSGLAYMYWRSETCPDTTWCLTAIDFATGQTVYKKRVGTGLGYNNWAGALFLHPQGGILYSTTIFGLVMIKDGSP